MKATIVIYASTYAYLSVQTPAEIHCIHGSTYVVTESIPDYSTHSILALSHIQLGMQRINIKLILQM